MPDSPVMDAGDIQQLRQSGQFTPQEISQTIETQRPLMKQAGFNDHEFNSYYGVPEPDDKPVSNYWRTVTDAFTPFTNPVTGAPLTEPQTKTEQGAAEFGKEVRNPETLYGAGRTDVPSLKDYMTAGWGESVTGLMTPHAEVTTEFPDNAPLAQRVAQSTATLAGDLPAMGVGFLGGAAGATGIGQPELAPFAAIAGAGALPPAMRKWMMDGYANGSIKSPQDAAQRIMGATWEGFKGAVVNLATMGANKLTGDIAGHSVMATVAAKLPAEVATMTTTQAALEGRLPKPEEFVTNGILIAGVHAGSYLTGGVTTKLHNVYAETGLDPKTVAKMAVTDPSIREDLINPEKSLPDALQKFVQPEQPQVSTLSPEITAKAAEIEQNVIKGLGEAGHSEESAATNATAMRAAYESLSKRFGHVPELQQTLDESFGGLKIEAVRPPEFDPNDLEQVREATGEQTNSLLTRIRQLGGVGWNPQDAEAPSNYAGELKTLWDNRPELRLRLAKKSGLPLDDLAATLESEGYIKGNMGNPAGPQELLDAMHREAAGNKVFPESVRDKITPLMQAGRPSEVSARHVETPDERAARLGISREELDNMLFQGAAPHPQDELGFYSKAAEVAEAKLPNTGTGAQHLQNLEAYAKNGDIKPEELEWSGVKEWLKSQPGKVSKADVANFLREGGVKLEEVQKGVGTYSTREEAMAANDAGKNVWLDARATNGGELTGPWSTQEIREMPDDTPWVIEGENGATGETKFDKFTIPGGANYREVLLTLPGVGESNFQKYSRDLAAVTGPYGDALPGKESEFRDLTRKLQNYQQENPAKLEQGATQYRSSHYDEPNVLAHFRLDDRTDAQGKKVLFIEEIQSDWHQAGRKGGYAGQLPQGWSLEQKGEMWELTNDKDQVVAVQRTREAALENLRERGIGNVPNAPFKKTWQDLALKRILRMAADGGYDKVAWTTGEQQAERYDLSKQVEKVEITKAANGSYLVGAFKDGSLVLERDAQDSSALADIVGKDLAAKADKQEHGTHSYSGVDLKVGGEGMKGFYDDIMPKAMNKLVKKWGGKSEQSNITARVAEGQQGAPPVLHQDDDGIYRGNANYRVHALELTPAIKEGVAQGLELFQGDKTNPRGSISLASGQSVIRLMESADASTFLHETGHFYWDTMSKLATNPKATPEIVGDWQTIRDWVGASEGKALSERQHEQVARGFERYLMEGKAPTPALAEVFARFKAWLTDIYKNARALRVNMTPEVRQVFDRLFSADEPAGTAQARGPATPETTQTFNQSQPGPQGPTAANPPPLEEAQRKVLERISMDGGDHRVFNVKNYLSSLYYNFVNQYHYLNQATDILGEGKDLPTKDNPYENALRLAGVSGKVGRILNYNTLDFKSGRPNGKGLQQVLEPVSEDLDNFRAYITAKRALELEGRGIKTGVDMAAAQSTVKGSEAKYEGPASELTAWNDRVLQYLRDSGVVSREGYDKMKEQNVFYVPFYRAMEEETPGSTGKGLQPRNPVKKIKGSERPIIDPLESSIKNAFLFTTLADKNNTVMSLVRLAEKAGGKGEEFVKKLPTPITATTATDQEASAYLQGYGISEPTPEEFTLFRRAALRPGPDEMVGFEDGKPQLYQLDPDLAKSVKGMDSVGANILVKMLSFPAKIQRAGITLSPEFLARNFIRDQVTAAILSPNGYRAFIDGFQGLASLVKKDQAFQEWLSSGGANAEFVRIDRNYMQEELQKILGEDGKVWNLVKSPLQALRLVSAMSEESTRLGEFKRSTRGDYSIEKVLKAGMDSREVTVDFARAGAAIRSWGLNKIYNFLGAGIQGFDREIRAFKDKPLATTVKSVGWLTLPTMALYLINRKDPRYNDLPNWQRDMFWIVPTDHWEDISGKEPQYAGRPSYLFKEEDGKRYFNNGVIFRIPKPYGGLSMIFSSGAERFADFVLKQDPHAFDGFLADLYQASTPGTSGLPPAMAPFFEVWANRSQLSGMPVIPADREKLLPEYQYQPYTTELSKGLGHLIAALPGMKDATVAAPVVIDTFISGWSGGLGTMAWNMADKGLRAAEVLPNPNKPNDTLSDVPLVRAFVVRYPSMGTQPLADFYDAYDSNQKRIDTIKTLAKQGDMGAALHEEELAKRQGRLIQLTPIKQGLVNITGTIRRINDAPNMPSEQKRQLIDNMYYQATWMARRGMDYVDLMKMDLQGK